MTQSQRQSHFKISGRMLSGRVATRVRTADGPLASGMKTVRTKAQADEAIAKLIGRASTLI